MANGRMTGMENLLGSMFGVKRSQPRQLVGVNNVSWIAVTEDYDHVELRNIKEARAVAKSGYADDRKIILIRRQQGWNGNTGRDLAFEIPNGILQERDYQGNLTREYGK
jgi:hypothetical protein